MSLDFLSGLLLAAVAVAGLAYIVREWFGLALPRLPAGQRAGPAPAADTNAHLIGARGQIVEAREETGEMRVRIGMERWSARLRPPASTLLPVGTEVEVKAVDGFVLEVAAKPAAAADSVS